MKYKVKKDKVIETRRYEDECKEKNIEPIPDRKLKLCEEIIENTIKQKLNRKHIKNKIKNGNKNIRNRRYPRKI